MAESIIELGFDLTEVNRQKELVTKRVSELEEAKRNLIEAIQGLYDVAKTIDIKPAAS